MRDVAFTVIIPAHNEAKVIERCLRGVLANAPAEADFEVIVAANGCSDDTAARARNAAPQATVFELPEGSKPTAMNSAKALAKHPICLFLDADVQCSFASLSAVARALMDPGVMAASPSLRMDLSQSSALVCAYYRVWLGLPYATDRLVGSGCFGLSRAALETIGDFPEIIGDDIWIRAQFDRSQRRSIGKDEKGKPVFFLVSPPRTLGDQIRVESRRRIGNRQADAAIAGQVDKTNQRGAHSANDLLGARAKGASWFDLGVYCATKLAVMGRVKWSVWTGSQHRWERDLAAREA
ncbi:MAG: glycosyltransferase family 2 protein [Pseudomonadota bacterium]